MPAQFSGKRLPNTAAAAFFARKLNLPSNEWSDLWREAHDKAFTVAGTLNDSGEKALAQIREAVRAAIEDGETIEEFKKRFDDIVAKTGWDYRGGRNFRARAIFETNLRTSWAAGRFAQMDEIKSERPFWQYRHGGSAQPRPEHLAWDGLILHADHPWWRTHYPPNGFGCTCHVVCLSAREVDREWKKAGGKGNPPKLDAHSPGIVFERGPRGAKSNPRLWTPPDPTKDLVEVKVKGRGVVQVPRGIDPGWDYVPGSEAFEAQKREELKRRAEAEQKREEARRRAEAEQKRRGFLAELDAALDSALAELKAIEADARAEVQKLGAPESVAREAFAQLEALVAEAIADARKAHANAKKGAEKIEFNEADERKAELVAVLRRIVERARRAAIDETRDTLQEAAQVLEAMRSGPQIPLAKPKVRLSDEEKAALVGLERPKKKLKRVAKRHFWSSAATKSWVAKDDSSILLPGTSWQEDLEEIEDGLAISAKDRNGAQIFVIDGRVYGVHPSKDGKALVPFPVQGDGIAPSARGVYKAVGLIQESATIAEAIKKFQLHQIGPKEAEAAWRVWDAIQRGKQR